MLARQRGLADSQVPPSQAYALLAAEGRYEVTFSEWSHRHWQFKRAMKNLSIESFEIKNEKGAA